MLIVSLFFSRLIIDRFLSNIGLVTFQKLFALFHIIFYSVLKIVQRNRTIYDQYLISRFIQTKFKVYAIRFSIRSFEENFPDYSK